MDPNRVLSLVLDAYECDPSNGAFLALVAQFKKAYLPHVLGFKFQFYAASRAANANAEAAAAVEPGPAPHSLHRLAASLLARGLVSLGDVLPHLSPSLSACAVLDAKRRNALEAAAAAVGKVNLNETAQQAADKRKAAGGSGGGRDDGLPSFDDDVGGGGGVGKSGGGGAEEGEEEGDGGGGGRGVAGSNQVWARVCALSWWQN